MSRLRRRSSEGSRSGEEEAAQPRWACARASGLLPSCVCVRPTRALGGERAELDGARSARAPAIGVCVCDAVSSVLGAGSTTLITADVKTANV